MAIIITDKFQLRQKNFLDDRQGYAQNLSALKSWDYSSVPIPEGFEVYVDGIWYIYKSSHTEDPITGKFRSREEEQGVNDHEARIRELEKESVQLFFEDGCDTASTFSKILTSAFWTDSTGLSHVRAGRVVTVTEDPDSTKNGVWYLTNTNYSSESSWIKLLRREDLITSTDNTTASSDINVYTAKKTDAIFPKKAGTEVVSGAWTFTDNATYEKDIIVGSNGKIQTPEVDATTGNIGTLNVTSGANIKNLNVENSTFTGDNIINSKTLKVTDSATIKNLSVENSTFTGDNRINSTTLKVTDSATIKNETVETSTIGSANINTATIKDGTFTENTNFQKDINVGKDINVTKDINVGTGGKITTPNIESTSGTISDLSATTLNVTEGATLNNINVSGGNYTGTNNFESINVGSNGSIQDEDGETVARVDKIVADTSDIKDLDDKVEETVGYLGVGNLLKNTGFTGQSLTEDYDRNTNLGDESEVFSDNLDDWDTTTQTYQVLENQNFLSGHCVYLPDSSCEISQLTPITLMDGTDYVISWRAKGTITVSIDNVELGEIKLLPSTSTAEYKTYYARFIAPGNNSLRVRIAGGPGYVGEIKLERGYVPTFWFPCIYDVDPISRQFFFKFEFLNTAFEEYIGNNDLTISSVLLKSQIKIGELINGEVDRFYGGLSGVFSDSSDVMFWAGSDYAGAQSLANTIINNPRYLDKLPMSSMSGLPKAVITFGTRSVLTDVYAVGKFRGDFINANGEPLRSFNVINGLIPCNTSSGVQGLRFENGVYVNNSGEPLTEVVTSINPNSTTQSTSMTFTNGLCSQISPDTPYTIWTGVGDIHTLRFRDGLLVKVGDANDVSSTYYWY